VAKVANNSLDPLGLCAEPCSRACSTCITLSYPDRGACVAPCT
jgi:hypothetical protein